MIPDSFTAFFAAIAGASGALVGLLFVAVSVSRDDVLGPHSSVANRVRSSLALTSLVAPLVLSLFALIPQIGIRTPAIIAGAIGLVFAASLLRRLATARDGRHWRQLSIVTGYLVIMIGIIVFGIVLQFAPDYQTAVAIIGSLLVALLGIGIDRAWELVGGRRSSVQNSVRDLIRGEPVPTEDPESPAARSD